MKTALDASVLKIFRPSGMVEFVQGAGTVLKGLTQKQKALLEVLKTLFPTGVQIHAC